MGITVVVAVILVAVTAAAAALGGLLIWKLNKGVRSNQDQHDLVTRYLNTSLVSASDAAKQQSSLDDSVAQEKTYIDQQLKAITDQVQALQTKAGQLQVAAQAQASAKATTFGLAAASVTAKANDIAPDYAAIQQQVAQLMKAVDRLQVDILRMDAGYGTLNAAAQARLQSTQLILSSVKAAMAGMDLLDATPEDLQPIIDALRKLDRTRFDREVLPDYVSKDDMASAGMLLSNMAEDSKQQFVPDSVKLLTDMGKQAGSVCPSAAQATADLQAKLTNASGDLLIPQGKLCLQDVCISADDITRARAAISAPPVSTSTTTSPI